MILSFTVQDLTLTLSTHKFYIHFNVPESSRKSDNAKSDDISLDYTR